MRTRINAMRLFLGTFLLLVIDPVAAYEADVHIYIKAFIPSKEISKNEVLRVTDTGQTALPAPILGTPVTFPHIHAGTCFGTDDRGYSKGIEPTASARITTEFILKIKNRSMVIEKYQGRAIARYGITKNIDCQTGAVLSSVTNSKKKNIRQATSSQFIGKVKNNGFKRVLSIRASAVDPFYFSYLAAAIDYNITFEYDILKRTITMRGTRGVFPAFEGYARVNNNVYTLFEAMPERDATPYSLIDLGTGINTVNLWNDKYVLKLR